MQSPHQSSSDPGDDAAFEELLADCIDVLASQGASELEHRLAQHPAHARALRERLATLQRLGMLEEQHASDARLPPVGPYLIERTLGHGGMSRVYLARHSDTGESVALKVLHTPLVDDQRASLRFEREVRAVSALSHPCIVTVHDSGVSDDLPWLAMEYVEGATLDKILNELREEDVRFEELDGAHVRGIAQRDSMEAPGTETNRGYVESICRIILDVCAALEHAHRFGIVHRDVKPANIVVTARGRAKLLDLGLASFEGSPSLTRTGDFAGTPYYVAPEQARSVQSADQRSDVFSLGVTLYEALTLRRPFEGQDAAEVFRNLQTCDPLPPGKHNPLLPRDLETVCLRALEKDPSERYGSMAELATDLLRFLEFKPILARPIGRVRRLARLARRHWSLSLLIAVLTLFVIGAPIVLVLVNEAIRQERDVANENAAEAARQARIGEAVVDHLVELFSPPAEYAASGLEWGWEEMLAASVARIPSELEEDPLLRAALLEAAGRIHANLERSEEAVPLLDRAYALRQRQLEGDHPSLGATLVWLAHAHLDANNPRAARSLASRGLEALEEHEGERNTAETFELRLSLARAAHQCDDSAVALSVLRRLEDLCTTDPVGFGQRLVDVDTQLAQILSELGETAAALLHGERALAGLRSAWVPDVDRLKQSLRLRGRLLEKLGRAEEAELDFAEANSLSSVFGQAREGLTGVEWRDNYPFEVLPPWTEDFEEAFQLGITSLQTRRPQEAIQAFEACLAITPDHPVCLYNLACAHAIAGDVEAALESLERARTQRFGSLQGNMRTLGEDPDLGILRGEPEFEELIADMAEARTTALERSESPRTFFPAARGDESPPSLIVVLSGDHVEGSQDRFEHWLAVAQSSGAALVYLEGILAGDESSWIAEVDNFLENPWYVEEAPSRALRAITLTREFEPGRAILVGEGSGAPVALDLALRAPGFFGAAFLIDGIALPATDGNALALARACGTRVRLLIGDGARLPDAVAEVDRGALVDGLGEWLRGGGIQAESARTPGRAIDLPVNRHAAELAELWKLLDSRR